jgi:oligopeptide/dipeptide ABC transporter ATP-binding protein
MNNLLSIEELKVNLLSSRGVVRGVRNINMSIKEGEVHGLVGESGCGKSMTAKSMMRLHDEKKMLYDGKILFGDHNILTLNKEEIKNIRGKEISMIFQDPMTALNPLVKVGKQIREMLLIHKITTKKQAKGEVLRLLEDVGIHPAEHRYEQYPFELSGGLLQRVMIAMAIACKPKLLIADEPTTALDVTVQAQILALLLKLREERNMSILIITHNFGVIAEICDQVSVMYAGTIVESGEVKEIFHHPKHPYTKDLIASIPKSDERGNKLVAIPGSPPDLKKKIVGCSYAPRCQYADDQCRNVAPEIVNYTDTHQFSCFKADKI